MIELPLEDRIGIVKRTRESAARALADTLRNSQASSERTICDRWLTTLSATPSINPDGWYQPPPKGVSVLIGCPDDTFARMHYDSLRNPVYWASDQITLRDDCLIYAYASPIDRATGLIGDIGVTLYRGTEQPIRDHLRTCLEMSARIARFSEVGMELREVFNYAQTQLEALNLSNSASSFGSGTPNIGHTIPWTYGDYSDAARQSVEGADASALRASITSHRTFVNAAATLRIQPTMAFTVEPQIISPAAPLCSYHLIVTFEKGQRSILGSFKALFETLDMNSYMQDALDGIS